MSSIIRSNYRCELFSLNKMSNQEAGSILLMKTFGDACKY